MHGYVFTIPEVCPKCKGVETEIVDTSIDGSSYCEEVQCVKCKHSWLDVYIYRYSILSSEKEQ